MARLDPENPVHAANLENIEALLEATGVSVDRLAMLNATSVEHGDFVGAVRVAGAETDVIKAAYIDSALDDLEQPRVEEIEIDGRPVTQLFDDARPDLEPLVVYVSDDTVWAIRGDVASASAVIEDLP